MWSQLLMTSAISCPLWSSVYECHKVECAFTSPGGLRVVCLWCTVCSVVCLLLLLSTHSHDPCQWGESDVPACGPPASFSGQQCSHSGGVCPQIQGRQCGAYVGAVEEMMCVVCVDVTEGA